MVDMENNEEIATETGKLSFGGRIVKALGLGRVSFKGTKEIFDQYEPKENKTSAEEAVQ